MLRFSFTSPLALCSTSSAAAAAAAVCSGAVRGGFMGYSPKADIHLDKFTFDSEYNNMRAKTGRAPDHSVANYRKMYYRVDELARRQEKFVRDQGYFYLPALDFPTYKGCMPLFSPEQLRLHFGRHHRAYVVKLNELLVGSKFLGMPLNEIMVRTEDDPAHAAIYNNAAQHYNHMFFWKSIKPFGTNMPPDLKAAIEQRWGSVEGFTKEFTERAMGLFGSGWTWLVWDSTALELRIVTTANAHTAATMPGIAPMLTCDGWEHSWYVDYESAKAEYIANFFKCADWHWAERNWKRAQGKEYHEMPWN